MSVAGDRPSVERELYLEGDYASSRRHDSHVRAVLNGGVNSPNSFYPNIETRDPFGRALPKEEIERQLEAWRERNAKAIRDTTLEDWIPTAYEAEGERLEALPPRCEDYYVPPPGGTNDGLTSVVSLDLDELSKPLGGAFVLGNADDVYANSETMVIAQQTRSDSEFSTGSTRLHRFEIENDMTRYVASGFVPGALDNQFSLDERDGIVRIATTTDVYLDESGKPIEEPSTQLDWERVFDFTTFSQVFTLETEGEDLKVLGSTERLAEGERIFSTRFVGDTAYVVTFRQVDPLFVIDLSDPKEPEVLGELKIPGFSEYMHPLDEGHLLTIGRDVSEDTGRDNGVLLQIFDVSDPSDPQLAHRYAYESDGYSQAGSNHKAFTYYEPKKTLVFPMVDYSVEDSASLQVFGIDPDEGFEARGSINHSALRADCQNEGDYTCYSRTEMRRGLFIGDHLYSISTEGILVHELENLDEAVSTTALGVPKGGYEDDF